MRLGELLRGLGDAEPREGADVEVNGIAIDSRRVRDGDLFFALPGLRTDGTRHAAEAVARGARAVVAPPGTADALGVPVVRTTTPRLLLGRAAARLAGDPSSGLVLVGVTGTNGKTTTTYLLESIWRAAGRRPAVIGTIAYRFDGASRPAPFTTPEAPDLQAMLAEMRAAGTTDVAIEVSSHALAQDRVAGCRFDAAVFTNLTRDHLDFHGDVERYYEAKARLFREVLPLGKPQPVAVVNIDDAAGARLAGEVPTRCVRVGRGVGTDVRALDAQSTLAGTRGVLALGERVLRFTCPLVGAAHLENIAVAAATAWALDVDPSAIERGLAALEPPPGRLEQIAGPGFTVVVDYAHTPDALARALAVLRPLTEGRLLVVFGCGGDRDRGKRPLMGEAAARGADVVVLTSDNPRSEDPDRIIAEIEIGVRRAGARELVIEPDRRAAIDLALGRTRPGDLVLIAGKGHEDYQIVGTEKRHFDDREEVRRVLRRVA